MTVISSLFTALAISATALPFAFASPAKNSCDNKSFWWDDLSCCLPNGGPTHASSPPSDKSCPLYGWSWNTDKGCCAPHSASPPPKSCAGDWVWNSSEKCCKAPPQPTCDSNSFWWNDLKACLPNGGPPTATPPSGKSCPSNGWAWHSSAACCVPKSPSPPSPSCSNSWSWSSDEKCCKPPSAPTCDNDSFWWSDLSSCIPWGGSPPANPPSGKSCPSNGWSWHSGKGCCTPHYPSPPPPTCNNGDWDSNERCCKAQPTPSGKAYHKRSVHSGRKSLCPAGLNACPIAGASGLTGDYECINTKEELESCGGCASVGKGQDCTAIKGAWNVGCEQGTCAVYTCAAGYNRSLDGKSCEKI